MRKQESKILDPVHSKYNHPIDTFNFKEKDRILKSQNRFP